MLLSTALLTSLFATLTLAAPALRLPTCLNRRQGAPFDTPDRVWTMQQFRRVCDDSDMNCEWSFTINTHRDFQAPTPCKYSIPALPGVPASMAEEMGADCGPFRVVSAWSGQFGPENGFTTLSVIDPEERLVAFPSYSDKQLEGGKVVVPDLEFVPHDF